MTSSSTLEAASDPRADPEDPKTGYPATPQHARYLGGLDGLRAFALVAILIGHLAYQSSIRTFWIRGDWLGVSTFFVLSGFLITRGLLHERDNTGDTGLARFWMRRAKRLLPALYAALLFLMIISVLDLTPPDTHLPVQFITTLFYVRNWYYLSFNGINGPVMFQYWSLSIEEQFYLVAPVVFLFSIKWLGRKKAVLVFIALGLASYTRAYFVSRSGNWDGVYFGTPTRVCEILAGVVLAFLVATDTFHKVEVRRWFRPLAQLTGAVGLVSIIVLWHITGVGWTTFHRSVPVNVARNRAGHRGLPHHGPALVVPVDLAAAVARSHQLRRLPVPPRHLLRASPATASTSTTTPCWRSCASAPPCWWPTCRTASSSSRSDAGPRPPAGGSWWPTAFRPSAWSSSPSRCPFPAAKHTKPVSLGTFATTDALAAKSGTRVAVVGDELAQSSLAGLHQIVDADPTRSLGGGAHRGELPDRGWPRGVARRQGRSCPTTTAAGCGSRWAGPSPTRSPPTSCCSWASPTSPTARSPDRTWGHLGQADCRPPGAPGPRQLRQAAREEPRQARDLVRGPTRGRGADLPGQQQGGRGVIDAGGHLAGRRGTHAAHRRRAARARRPAHHPDARGRGTAPQHRGAPAPRRPRHGAPAVQGRAAPAVAPVLGADDWRALLGAN